MPAFLARMAIGLVELRQRLGNWQGLIFSVIIGGMMLFLNIIGLQPYWAYPKSPKGLAVFRLRSFLQSGSYCQFTLLPTRLR